MEKRLPVIFAAIFLSGLIHARILSGPWLQAVTPHSVAVLVESDSRDSVTVVFRNGNDPEQTSGSILTDVLSGRPLTWLHLISITNLTPMTRYRYSLQQGGAVSQEYFFFTAVEPGNPFRAIWMADFPDKKAEAASILQYAANADPMVIFYGSSFFPSIPHLKDGLERKERDTKSLHSFVPFYSALPPLFRNSEDTGIYIRYPSSGTDSFPFYSVDYGDLHVLYLNSSLPLDTASSQYHFARLDIARSRQQWKIVMTDLLPGCPGCSVDPDFSRLIREELEPGGVNIILSTAPHRYQHHRWNGIHYLMAGMAEDHKLPDIQDGSAWEPGRGNPFYLIMDVATSRLKIFVHNEQNQQMEMIDLRK